MQMGTEASDIPGPVFSLPLVQPHQMIEDAQSAWAAWLAIAQFRKVQCSMLPFRPLSPMHARTKVWALDHLLAVTMASGLSSM